MLFNFSLIPPLRSKKFSIDPEPPVLCRQDYSETNPTEIRSFVATVIFSSLCLQCTAISGVLDVDSRYEIFCSYIWTDACTNYLLMCTEVQTYIRNCIVGSRFRALSSVTWKRKQFEAHSKGYSYLLFTIKIRVHIQFFPIFETNVCCTFFLA